MIGNEFPIFCLGVPYVTTQYAFGAKAEVVEDLKVSPGLSTQARAVCSPAAVANSRAPIRNHDHLHYASQCRPK